MGKRLTGVTLPKQNRKWQAAMASLLRWHRQKPNSNLLQLISRPPLEVENDSRTWVSPYLKNVTWLPVLKESKDSLGAHRKTNER